MGCCVYMKELTRCSVVIAGEVSSFMVHIQQSSSCSTELPFNSSHLFRPLHEVIIPETPSDAEI
ncbi:hypothetical protein BDV37DRAFT_266268 [Aspergillus pseudonomiae]|uniref:Uncharacterized protein n=1 Tax=Aspergillus pseudonomiae TaxID=1506151 RepID=A0A5N7CSI1_9EURO|nr:uncharacterized protein BDV37DRAFT_266268 [Aspergillus pseudonomiae]KAE8397200.1 hypothetical protein BDV37DRAFT_266268 [Aspergillus pseudonomiae]